MSIQTTKLSLIGAALPPNHTLVGYIDQHPADKQGSGYAVIRSAIGIESAWDGTAIRSLPRGWRERATFEAARPSVMS